MEGDDILYCTSRREVRHVSGRHFYAGRKREMMSSSLSAARNGDLIAVIGWPALGKASAVPGL